MSKNPTLTKYIPAGVQINSTLEMSVPKKKKKTKPKSDLSDLFQDSFGSCQTQPLEDSVDFCPLPQPKPKQTPPKTICKNKTLVGYLDDLNISFDSTRHTKDETSPQTTSESDLNQDTVSPKSFKNKLLERLKQRTRTIPAIESSSEEYSSDNAKKCKCDNCDGFIKCPQWGLRNLTFEEPSSAETLPFFATRNQSRSALLKTFDSRMLMHGPLIPRPVHALGETCINVEIQSVLLSLKCESANLMQSYMWPSVQRGLNVCIVAPPKSGKTFAYLPTLCSLALEKEDKYQNVYKYEGPLSVVFCLSEQKCEQFLALVKTLVGNCLDKIAVGGLSGTVRQHDLLVTTPASFEDALRSGRVKLKRLCHLVIEDAHLVLKNYNKSMEKIFEVINRMQSLRPHNKNVQVIMITEKWSADTELLLKKLYVRPLVYCEDFLEGALYSRMILKRKTLVESHKLFYLKDILKANHMTQKSVVFCDEDEVIKIHEFFGLDGIECISLCTDMTEDEIFENEQMWMFLQKGHYKVLLCTDAVFDKTVQILGADRLIHYNLPSNWTEFKKRFRCLSGNFCSPLELEVSDICCVVTLDQNGNDFQLDFLDVLQRHSIMESIGRA